MRNIDNIKGFENIDSLEDIKRGLNMEIKREMENIKSTVTVLTESYNSAIFKAFKDMQHISEKLDNLSSYEKEQILLDFLGQYQTEKEK